MTTTIPTLERTGAHLSHGFYRVSERTARALASQYPARYAGRPSHGSPYRMRKLPLPGSELHVEHNGKSYWLARTPLDGRMVWSVRAL
jgi:hypothetical protein